MAALLRPALLVSAVLPVWTRGLVGVESALSALEGTTAEVLEHPSLERRMEAGDTYEVIPFRHCPTARSSPPFRPSAHASAACHAAARPRHSST